LLLIGKHLHQDFLKTDFQSAPAKTAKKRADASARDQFALTRLHFPFSKAKALKTKNACRLLRY